MNNACCIFPFITGVINLDALSSGNVDTGMTANSPKLEVACSEKATSFISNTASYDDFVFQPDYVLPALNEVEAHHQKEDHLSGNSRADSVCF